MEDFGRAIRVQPWSGMFPTFRAPVSGYCSALLKKVLFDSCQCLFDCSHPQRRIICGAVVIRSADICISLAKGCHNGNSGQGLSEMSGKLTSFFPRRAVPDHDDAY